MYAIGQTLENNLGLEYEIIEDLGSSYYLVKFLASGYEVSVRRDKFKTKRILDRKHAADNGSVNEFSVGRVYMNNAGEELEVKEFINSLEVKIRFVKTGYEATVQVPNITAGAVRDKLAFISKGGVNSESVGRTYTNNVGEEYKVIDYRSTYDIEIEFIKTGYRRSVPSCMVTTGEIKDLLSPCIHGVGFIGDGPFNKKDYPGFYDLWRGMFERCYDEKSLEKHPTYRGCHVDSAWHNFQHFMLWAIPRFKEGHHLDKDLKIYGNKVYGPDTCLFIPAGLNSSIAAIRLKTSGLPLGISMTKGGKYEVVFSEDDAKRTKVFRKREYAFRFAVSYKMSLMQKYRPQITSVTMNYVYSLIKHIYGDI